MILGERQQKFIGHRVVQIHFSTCMKNGPSYVLGLVLVSNPSQVSKEASCYRSRSDCWGYHHCSHATSWFYQWNNPMQRISHSSLPFMGPIDGNITSPCSPHKLPRSHGAGQGTPFFEIVSVQGQQGSWDDTPPTISKQRRWVHF